MSDYVTSRALRDRARPVLGEEYATAYWFRKLAIGRAALEETASSAGSSAPAITAFFGRRS